MKKKNLLIALTLVFSTFLWSCGSGNTEGTTTNEPKEEHNEEASHDHAKTDDCTTVHWGYSDNEGPDKWASLCTGFSACAGANQSPIDIDIAATEQNEGLSPLAFDYKSSATNIINNGHTVQFNIDEGSSVTISDKSYQLLQFHFHTASEHTVNGKQYPMEVHFVHKNTDTGFAVVGIFYEEGAENALLAKYLANFPKEKGEYTSDSTLELASLLPEKLGYFHYAGSLTTPPCSEVVSWYVLQQPLTASKEQIEAFAAILKNNFRPVQPLNDRKLYSFQ